MNVWEDSPDRQESASRKLRIQVKVLGATMDKNVDIEDFRTDDESLEDSVQMFTKPSLFNNAILSNRVSSAKPPQLRGNQQ